MRRRGYRFHRNFRTVSLAALFAGIMNIAGCIVAPPQSEPVPQPAPPPPDYRYQQVQQCRVDNRRAHQDVVDLYERARAAGRINPAEAQQFYAMESRLRDLRGQLARDGLTLPECQYIGGEIGRMRTEVDRMSRYDPALAACLADNRRAHQEVYALYDDARCRGRVVPSEAQRFAAIDGRLTAMRRDLERPGMTLADCQRISGAIVREREEVIQMTRFDPSVRRCMGDNWRAREDIYRIYNNALAAGRIDSY